MKLSQISASISLTVLTLVAPLANAYTVSYYRTMTTGWSGNSQCFAIDCSEASPENERVNCRHLSTVDFSIGSVADQRAAGYAIFNWLPGSASEFGNNRAFTIDGNFDIKGFQATDGFKSMLVGTNERIPIRSAKVDFLPPYGAEAIATVDFGGAKPLVINLECCRDGICDSEKPADPTPGPHVQPWQDPPTLCPAYPKEAFDKCMGIKSNIK